MIATFLLLVIALSLMCYGAAAVAIIGAGVSMYEGDKNRKEADKNRPPPPPRINPQPDEAPLSDQRKKRMMSAAGRDGTILAPVGINGSPLGGPSLSPGAAPAKTTLGG